MNKYEVGTEEDGVLGIYYGETEYEALAECRADHFYSKYGERMGFSDCGVSGQNLLHELIARKVDY